MKCNIIQDLLPLYCENLTSYDSNQEIEQHLQTCHICKDFYQTMKQNEMTDKQPVYDIQPLKKVRRSGMIKAILSFLAGAALLTIIFLFLFWGIIPAKQEDIQVYYTAEILEDGNYSINFDFSQPENWVLNDHIEKNINNDDVKNISHQTELKLYCVKKLPFDDRGTGGFSLGFSKPRPFSETDIVVIHYRDGDIVYSLKEIAEQAGLQ